jgi:hypothetical protein
MMPETGPRDRTERQDGPGDPGNRGSVKVKTLDYEERRFGSKRGRKLPSSYSLPRMSRISSEAGLRVIGAFPRHGSFFHHPIQFLHLARW